MTIKIEELLSKFRCEFTHNNGEQNKLNGLLEMIRDVQLDKTMLVVEVGSFAGVSSELFAIHCKTIFCVDSWKPYSGIPKRELVKGEKQFDEMLQRQNNVVKVKMDSLEAAALFADGVFDLCYIDADHSYDSVNKDIKAWLPKIKSGGWIAGHDFIIPTVESAIKNNLSINNCKRFADTSWLIQIPTVKPPRIRLL